MFFYPSTQLKASQSVTSPIADLGVVCSIPAWPHTFVQIDYEIFSTVILLLPLILEGLFSVTSKYGH